MDKKYLFQCGRWTKNIYQLIIITSFTIHSDNPDKPSTQAPMYQFFGTKNAKTNCTREKLLHISEASMRVITKDLVCQKDWLFADELQDS